MGGNKGSYTTLSHPYPKGSLQRVRGPRGDAYHARIELPPDPETGKRRQRTRAYHALSGAMDALERWNEEERAFASHQEVLALRAEVAAVRERVAALTEALTWYAHPASWHAETITYKPAGQQGAVTATKRPIDYDGGQRALTALGAATDDGGVRERERAVIAMLRRVEFSATIYDGHETSVCPICHGREHTATCELRALLAGETGDGKGNSDATIAD